MRSQIEVIAPNIFVMASYTSFHSTIPNRGTSASWPPMHDVLFIVVCLWTGNRFSGAPRSSAGQVKHGITCAKRRQATEGVDRHYKRGDRVSFPRTYRNAALMKAQIVACALMVLCLVGGFSKQARAEVLITAEEAKLPANNVSRRAVFLGPIIELVSPRPDLGPVRSPIRLVLKFRNHGGAKVDLGTLTVTYLKKPTIDLSARIAPFATAEGINMPIAEVPAGSHRLWFDIERFQRRSWLDRIDTSNR